MIPSIDCQAIDHAALNNACRDWGFFALANHDIDPALIENSLLATEQFFQQSTAEKKRVSRSEANCWGYNDAELTKNKRDWKEILDIGPAVDSGPLKGASPQWPDIPGFRNTLSELSRQVHRVALAMVDDIATCLGAPIDLDDAFGKHSSFLRLNYYPPCPDPASDTVQLVAPRGELGISHHSDAGALTVLVQDGMSGLQVYHDGRWVDVSSDRGTVLINIGDVVQVWSNDAFKAPLHRVAAHPTRSRVSIPYFLNPDYAHNYAPLSGQPRYHPINWGDFRAQRTAGDYADLGSEIQIADFAITQERRGA
ncbi:MAG: isopenicillin N synthase family dioxygenase [Halioglobus sp.]